MSLLTKILSAEPLQPSQIKPGLDPRLERLCLKAMAKEPADRFSTMQEFADALKTVQDSVPARELQTKHDSPRHMAPKPSKSKSKERFNGDVDRHRFKSLAKIIGSAIGFAAMLYGVIVFLPTPKGMIRVEVLEPKLEVVVNSTGATIQGEGTEALQLKPGIQSFRIMHGEFEFQTDSFVLRKGDEIQVKIEWIEGALVAKKDGQLLESRLLKSPQPQPNVREQPRQANVNQPKASTESLTQKQALDIDMLLEQMRESGAEIAVNHELLPPAKWSSITVEACNVYLSPEFALTKYEMGLLLARLPGLYSLTICGNLFEPEAIGLVRGSGICKLSVEHCHGRPPGTIDQLTQLDTIKELHLYDCEIEDADLVRICGLKQLKTLQIGANEITSEGVRALKQLENLEVLFGSVPTEDPKAAAHLLSTLQSCKKLRHLVMSALPASDLSALGQLRSLRRLDLYSMGKPILDLSPVIETEIQMIELDSYNATLHHDVILRAENLETINRIPKEEFLKTHAGSILQDD